MVQTKTALRMIMMMKLGQIEVLVAEKVRGVRKARGKSTAGPLEAYSVVEGKNGKGEWR